MRQHSTRLVTTCHPARPILSALVIATMIASGLALPRAYGFLAHPPGARLTSQDVSRRMIVLANAYRAPGMLEGQPVFRDRDVPVPSVGGVCRRVFWQGSVHVSDQTLDLFINDRTGNLMCAYNTGDLGDSTTPAIVNGATIDTPVQAARLSLQEARKLRLIPPHCEAAMVGAPERHGRQEMWRVEWKVRKAPAAVPYTVVVIMQGRTGRLLSVTNSEELGRRIGRLD